MTAVSLIFKDRPSSPFTFFTYTYFHVFIMCIVSPKTSTASFASGPITRLFPIGISFIFKIYYASVYLFTHVLKYFHLVLCYSRRHNSVCPFCRISELYLYPTLELISALTFGCWSGNFRLLPCGCFKISMAGCTLNCYGIRWILMRIGHKLGQISRPCLFYYLLHTCTNSHGTLQLTSQLSILLSIIFSRKL